MADPATLQPFADRLAGLPPNGHKATDFQEPLATLWRDLDARATDKPADVLVEWVGADQARLDLAAEIFRLMPGAAPPPDPWQIRTLKDAFKPRPPLQFIVEDLIVSPSLVMTYGAPASMKSLLMADMLTCIAGDRPWLRPLDPKEKTARYTATYPVLWLDFDNGVRRTDERFEALARAHNIPDTAPINYVSMPNPWLDLGDGNAVTELKQRIARLGSKVTVIDNLGIVMGTADENSAEMIRVMGALRNIVEECQITVIALHHQRKGNGTNSRAGETIRGHSSIEAALDLALLVEREEFSDQITIKGTKTRDIDVYEFGAQFEYTHKPGTKELETARFWGTVVEDKSSNRAISKAIEDALTARQPQTQSELRASVKALLPKIGDNRIRGGIAKLVKLGTVIERRSTSNNAILYELI